MIVEQHYDDEILIGLLDSQASDPHLQSCSTCKASLNAIRNVTSTLHDPAVWDERELNEEPRKETKDKLRAFATSVAAEDAAAEPWVKALLAKPSSEWRAIVDAHPEWCTAGFVRQLIKAVDAINFTAPTDAVELTKIAVHSAEALASNGVVGKLRAMACREYAYALYYIGSYEQSLIALERADQHLRDCAVRDYDAARIEQVRSYVLSATEKFDAALAVAGRAKRAFEAFGDARRTLAMNMLVGTVMIRMRRFREGLSVQLEILRNAAADNMLRASAMNNAAVCYRELGRFDEAKKLLVEAIEILEQMGMITHRNASRWQLASIFVHTGDHARGLALLQRIRDEYAELGQAHNLALVYVDMAEALLISDRPQDVAALCAHAMDYFSKSGLTYTSGALTALAYLREAAEKKSLTVAAVHDVRSFFEILPQQPQLLFARPA